MRVRFSILTPSYNYAHFLPDMLESVARQEGVELEHVVIDDGSTDDSMGVLQRWHGHPLALSTQSNAGLSVTLNRALDRATGDVIGWLNADDFYLPGALQRIMHAFDDAPDVDVVYGDSVFVDAQARVIQLKPQHRMDRHVLRWYECFIAPCAAFRRRESLPTPAWNQNMRALMDWDQDLQMQAAGARFLHLPVAVAAFRRHGQQQSALRYDTDAAEMQLLVDRHALPLSGVRRMPAAAVGHVMHAGLKAQAGGYLRQLRTRRLAGSDTRWWASGDAARVVEALIAAT